jgi:vitamin B12 transporter
MLTRSTFLAYFSCTVALLGLSLQTEGAEELPALTVMGQETANQRPASTYESPISNLEFDPRVDMQVRNITEAQGDISIRGGTFEETGVQIGSVTLLDPQTGHYNTELLMAPEMLGEPKVLTGADNAMRGFNSNAGTVSYSWSEITKGGSLTIGGGDHNLNFQRIHNALTGTYGNSKDWTWGAEIEGARSESDGTIPNGDHAFDRTSGRIQLLGPDSQTDLFAGYQDKFYGWPGMYSTKNYDETEDYQIRLFSLNHKQEYDEGHLELSGFYKRLSDHFILDRTTLPAATYYHYDAQHETTVHGFSLSGKHQINENFSINHFGQYTYDKMDDSKVLGAFVERPTWHLKNGDFTDRQYYKLSLVPEYKKFLDKNEVITYKAGVAWDDTNRDKQRFSPIAEISWSKTENEKNSENIYLSYSESTQVLGYGAIGGSTDSGTFRSTRDLRRSVSKNLELGYKLTKDAWKLNTAIFQRRDYDLVDWTFDSNWTSYRKANHVDVKTFGFEIIASRQLHNFEAICSYAYLKKSEDYADPSVLGSFYALNYPVHRITIGAIWNPIDSIELRMDNEWREQRDNLVRREKGSPNRATVSHFAASYYPKRFEDLELFVAFEKPWEKDFQEIPGIAAKGDQFSFGATYSW